MQRASDSQQEFFCATFPLGWLATDETLYSLASRYARLAVGGSTPQAVTARLFGVSHRDQHDLPVGIDCFVERTHGVLGDAESVIRGHTILSFFSPFRPARDSEDAVAAMRGRGLGSTKYRLGMLTSGLGAGHPLKACRACIDEDHTGYGVAYWHLDHQYPGVWVCLRHLAPLCRLGSRTLSLQRFAWYLPAPETMVPVLANDAVRDERQLEALYQLASAAHALANAGVRFHFDPGQLLRTYHAALDARGLLTGGGNLRLKTIAADFERFFAPFSRLPEFSAVPVEQKDHGIAISRLLRHPRSGSHPLRHLAVILWLFTDWEKFWAAYLRCDEEDRTHSASPQPPQDVAPARSQTRATFLDLVGDGQSVTTTGRRLGIDPATAIAWAADAGVATARRPKKITIEIYTAIVGALAHGEDKAEVARRFGLSTVTVSRLLKRELGLLDRWTEARRLIDIKRHRATWTARIADLGHLGVKILRGLEPAVYAWLYRNDRAWLIAQNALIAIAPTGNNSHVDWGRRDEYFLAEVRRVLLELSNAPTPSRITLSMVLECLPALRAKMKRLDRMPRTHQALEALIGRSADSLRDSRQL
ncbi:MAG: hypothetical protein EOM26_09055 [Alphaproteobacteria bacterium]|nr:hypothetical protein [Alphaproteobacteria bacterium]